MIQKNVNVTEIVNFALEHSGYYNSVEREYLERYAAIHIQYGTLLYIPGVALARWNVLPSGDTLHIIDVIIAPEYRCRSMLRWIGLQIWKMWPAAQYFYYDKNKTGKSYGYEVKNWFKLKEK